MKNLATEIVFVLLMILIYTFFQKFVELGVEFENVVVPSICTCVILRKIKRMESQSKTEKEYR